jgi:hypothetical protein
MRTFEVETCEQKDIQLFPLHTLCFVRTETIAIGGLVVIVLATGPKVSKPAENDGLLRAIKIPNTTSFAGEVKPAAPCRKILRHVKDPYSMKDILVGKIHGHFSPSFSFFATTCSWRLLPESSGG